VANKNLSKTSKYLGDKFKTRLKLFMNSNQSFKLIVCFHTQAA
jgi:hypothetical protein